MHVAFVTSASYADLTADDRLAVTALAARGVRVSPAVWTDPSVAWGAFDAVVVRSTWDYHRRPTDFRRWIDAAERAGARLWNPAPVLRWNMAKGYLRDLAARGVATVPTAWLARGRDADLAAVLDAHGWDAAVVKPAVSATAFGTWRTSRADAAAHAADLAALLAAGDVMVQPYLAEIERGGEWSLVFLDGAFSHAVRKRPRAGDFRVQTEFGGRADAETPPPAVRTAAERALDAVPGAWLYARVDGVETASGFVLIELELLEPSLFLDADPGAAARMAEAVVRAAGRAP